MVKQFHQKLFIWINMKEEPSEKELREIERQLERLDLLSDDSCFEIEEDDFIDDGHMYGLDYLDDFED